MYCHPHAVKKWARAMKPAPSARLIEQARIMRAARIARREFADRQGDLFTLSSQGEKTAYRTATGSGLTFA